MIIYNKPQIGIILNGVYSIYNIPDKCSYDFSIEEQSKIVANETIDGYRELDYFGEIFIISLNIKDIYEDSNWINWYNIITAIRQGNVFDFFPSGYNQGNPYNYYSQYLNCVVLEPSHLNARYERTAGRWQINLRAQTNEYI